MISPHNTKKCGKRAERWNRWGDKKEGTEGDKGGEVNGWSYEQAERTIEKCRHWQGRTGSLVIIGILLRSFSVNWLMYFSTTTESHLKNKLVRVLSLFDWQDSFSDHTGHSHWFTLMSSSSNESPCQDLISTSQGSWCEARIMTWQHISAVSCGNNFHPLFAFVSHICIVTSATFCSPFLHIPPFHSLFTYISILKYKWHQNEQYDENTFKLCPHLFLSNRYKAGLWCW